MAKVLMYSLIYPPDVTANAYIFHDIADELVKRGHDVSVITTTPHYSNDAAMLRDTVLKAGKKSWYRIGRDGEVRTYHICVAPQKGGRLQRVKSFYAFHRYALPLVKEENIEADVVITQTPPMTVGVINAKLAKKLNAKSILILQDLWLDSMVKRNKIKGIVKTVLRKIELKTYKENDAVTTISPEMAEVVIPRIDEGKLCVIPNFVDTSIYSTDYNISALKKEYGINDEFVISYVGNLGNAQNLEPVIRYVANNKDKKIKVLVAGNGIKEEYFRNLAKELGAASVNFLGYIDRTETPKINAVSDVCLVMLARHVVSTSFPSKIYTIMACGKPILMSCTPGCTASNFIEKSRAGWVADVNDDTSFAKTLDILYERPAELSEYGRNALETIERSYSKDVVGAQYEQLVKKLIEVDK